MANIKNLRPQKITSVEQAKEMGRKGGLASVKAHKEKKLMSQIYAEFLEEEYEIEIDEGDKKKLSGSKLLKEVIKRVSLRSDSASVSLMKEIREATEGSKTKLVGEDGGPVEISVIKRVIVG